MRWYEWAFVAAFVLLVISAIGSWIEGSAACERKGGTYFCAHSSSCICLAPGLVLP